MFTLHVAGTLGDEEINKIEFAEVGSWTLSLQTQDQWLFILLNFLISSELSKTEGRSSQRREGKGKTLRTALRSPRPWPTEW